MSMTRPVAVRAITRYTVDGTVDSVVHDQDMVAVEAPVSLVLCPHDGPPRNLGLLMRTPGHDEDLATGVLVTEGVITRATDVLRIEHVTGDEAVVRVFVGPNAHPLAISDRVGSATSACGLCGRLSLQRLDAMPRIDSAALRVSAAVIHRLPPRLRDVQLAFAQTGGLHAAAVFSADGTLVDLREDVGRHNAVDKIAGALLHRGGLPASDLLLAVSGRIAYEIVQKAVMCGMSIIVAVGAPTDLAVDAARATGVTLIGFTRDNRFNVYTHGHRIGTGEYLPE
ncbi:MAG: formate dehydrogenase accessory sulfurtransferase FdhD [Acidobacteria bacterium]|nr:formate dehydrogenase accessory sulfurtransferase FdhD [Acidobacteriota bacterium]